MSSGVGLRDELVVILCLTRIPGEVGAAALAPEFGEATAAGPQQPEPGVGALPLDDVEVEAAAPATPPAAAAGTPPAEDAEDDHPGRERGVRPPRDYKLFNFACADQSPHIPADVPVASLSKTKELHNALLSRFESGDVVKGYNFSKREAVHVGDRIFISPSSLNRIGELLALHVVNVEGDSSVVQMCEPLVHSKSVFEVVRAWGTLKAPTDHAALQIFELDWFESKKATAKLHSRFAQMITWTPPKKPKKRNPTKAGPKRPKPPKPDKGGKGRRGGKGKGNASKKPDKGRGGKGKGKSKHVPLKDEGEPEIEEPEEVSQEDEGELESEVESGDGGDVSDSDPLKLLSDQYLGLVSEPNDGLTEKERKEAVEAALTADESADAAPEHHEHHDDDEQDEQDEPESYEPDSATNKWLDEFALSLECILSRASAFKRIEDTGGILKPVSMSMVQEDSEKQIELVHWRSAFHFDGLNYITTGTGQRVRPDLLGRAITPTHFWDPNMSRVGWQLVHPDIGLQMFKQEKRERDPIPLSVFRLSKMMRGSCSVSVLSVTCFRCNKSTDNLRTCAFCLLTAHPACLNNVPDFSKCAVPATCALKDLPASFTADDRLDSMCKWCSLQFVPPNPDSD